MIFQVVELTWEDWSNKILKGAQKSYQELHHTHPEAPRMPTVRILGRLYSEVAKT